MKEEPEWLKPNEKEKRGKETENMLNRGGGGSCIQTEMGMC